MWTCNPIKAFSQIYIVIYDLRYGWMIPEVMNIRFEEEYLILGLENYKFDKGEYFGLANLELSFYPSIRSGGLFMN